MLAKAQTPAKPSNDRASVAALGPLVLCSTREKKSKGKHYCKLNSLLPPFMVIREDNKTCAPNQKN